MPTPPAESLPLRLRDKGVAGTHDLVRPGDALRPISQGGHGLGPAAAEYPVHPRNPRRRQNNGSDLSAAGGGRNHHDLGAPGDLGGYAVHENGRGQGGGAAGDIYANFFNGRDLLAQHHAGLLADRKPVLYLSLVEGADIFRRFLQYRPKIGLQIRQGLVQLFAGDLQRIDVRMVELLCVPPQGGVAVFPDLGDDPGYDAGNIPLVLRSGQNFREGNLTRL